MYMSFGVMASGQSPTSLATDSHMSPPLSREASASYTASFWAKLALEISRSQNRTEVSAFKMKQERIRKSCRLQRDLYQRKRPSENQTDNRLSVN